MLFSTAIVVKMAFAALASSLYQTSAACTSTASASTTQPTGGNQFINQDQWTSPVVGQQTKLQWSPSSDVTISLELTYLGYVPNNNNSVWLTDSAPNTGSFTWDVPLDFKAGEYLLSITHPGVLFDDTQAVVVETVAPSVCDEFGSSRALDSVESSNTTSSMPSSATAPTSDFSASLGSQTATSTSSQSRRAELFSTDLPPALLTADYASILAITSCSVSITPSYTSYISDSTTTSFAVVGCSDSATTTFTGTCHSGDDTFSVSGTSIVCCPSDWKTSIMGGLYCYTSAASLGAGTTSTNVDIWGWSTQSGIAIVTDTVFSKADLVKTNAAIGNFMTRNMLLVAGVLGVIVNLS